MDLAKVYNVKEILVELQQRHKDLIELFPKFNIYSTIELGTIYDDENPVHVETPIFMIHFFYQNILADSNYSELASEKSYFWNDIDKFADVYILPQ